MLGAAQGGDEAAFSRLFRDGNPPLMRYLRVVSSTDVEDVAAETWVSVVAALPRFRGDEVAWRAWLFTTARRRAIDQGRRRSRHPAQPVADLPETQGRAGDDPAELALENLDTENAIAFIRTLPPLQAEVILLRVVAGLPVESVARLTGRSPGAVRVAAYRGLRQLAALLDGVGVTR